jgi:integrase
MATFRKRSGSWRVEVVKNGSRTSATFDTKAEAQKWAVDTEQKIAAGKHKTTTRETLHGVIDSYIKDVCPRHKGERWERVRLEKIKRDIDDKPISKVTKADIADWRDKRMKDVGHGSIRREMGLLGSVFRVAVVEWGLIESSPMEGVYKPPAPPHRDRLVSDAERDAVVAELNKGGAKKREVAIAFLVSLETAMRAGEVLSLTPDSIVGRVAILYDTKNGEKREVPLSLFAVDLLNEVGGKFTISSASLDALFRAARDDAGLSGFTFHDGRATALTRLAEKLDVLELARMVGHRDPRSLMIYYRKSAADIALKL